MTLIEVELKARVRDTNRVRAALEARSAGVDEVYADTYYDTAARSLEERDEELRVRTVTNSEGSRSMVTYKTAPVEETSGSRPEHETQVTDPAVIETLLQAVGAVPVIAFSKHCRNHRFTASGLDILATLVEVPEIEGTFIEVETLGSTDKVDAALDIIRGVLSDIGITEDDLTTETYTSAVAAARADSAT